MTGLVALVTVLPLASCDDTCTAGVMVAWVNVFEGCTENASFTAVGTLGAVMVKPVLVAEVRVGLVADRV